MKTTMPCAKCGVVFVSYNPRPQFCSRACKAEAAKVDVDTVEIVRLYESGMTIDEVAAALHTTAKVIGNRLRGAGCQRRKAVKRNQRGSANSSWRGSDATYATFHKRVEVARGTPSACDGCGTTEACRYEWANLTGNYQDTDDYSRLCVSCHRKHDAARRRATGNATSKHVPRARKGMACV